MNNYNELNDYQETMEIIEVVEGEAWYSILIDGLCCGLKREYGKKPKVGDLLTLHTKGDRFGMVRGMDLNGAKVFWKTDEELQQAE